MTTVGPAGSAEDDNTSRHRCNLCPQHARRRACPFHPQVEAELFTPSLECIMSTNSQGCVLLLFPSLSLGKAQGVITSHFWSILYDQPRSKGRRRKRRRRGGGNPIYSPRIENSCRKRSKGTDKEMRESTSPRLHLASCERREMALKLQP